MEHIAELVKARRSVRTFDGWAVSPDDLEKLSSFMEQIENPYGIPMEFELLDGKSKS